MPGHVAHPRTRGRALARQSRLAALALLGACAATVLARTPAGTPLQIDGVVFVNRASTEIVDLQLRVDALDALVACEYIPRDGECVTTFPLRRYQGNRLTITWRQGVQPYIIADVIVAPPSEPPASGRVKVYFFIGERGRLDAAMHP